LFLKITYLHIKLKCVFREPCLLFSHVATKSSLGNTPDEKKKIKIGRFWWFDNESIFSTL